MYCKLERIFKSWPWWPGCHTTHPPAPPEEDHSPVECSALVSGRGSVLELWDAGLTPEIKHWWAQSDKQGILIFFKGKCITIYMAEIALEAKCTLKKYRNNLEAKYTSLVCLCLDLVQCAVWITRGESSIIRSSGSWWLGMSWSGWRLVTVIMIMTLLSLTTLSLSLATTTTLATTLACLETSLELSTSARYSSSDSLGHT